MHPKWLENDLRFSVLPKDTWTNEQEEADIMDDSL